MTKVVKQYLKHGKFKKHAWKKVKVQKMLQNYKGKGQQNAQKFDKQKQNFQ